MTNNFPITVLFIIDYQAEHAGSFIQSILSLSKKLHKNRCSIHYVFPRGKSYTKKLEQYGDVTYLNSFSGKRFDLQLLLKTYKIVGKKNVDIIHTHFGLAGAIAASIVSRLTGTQHINHSRNPSPHYGENGNYLRKKKAKLFFKMLDLTGHNHYIAISRGVKSSLVEYSGISSRKIEVINNAIDIKDILRKKAKPLNTDNGRRLTTLANKNNVVGMVGHFSKQKDHSTLIKAAKRIVNRSPDTIFFLIGTTLVGKEDENLSKAKDLVHRLGLKKKVHFLGELENPMPAVNLFDVGVLSSNYEGFGNVVVEYMINNKPVVATNTGGIPDIVVDGETGYLCPKKDVNCLAQRIIELIDDRKEAKRMGDRGYQLAKDKFNMERWVDNIMAYYRRII